MLPKKYRLKKKSAFTATYRTGTVINCNGITAFLGRKKVEDMPTKFGFVVSKKIHKRAVKRNRIRRLIREAVRLYIKQHEKLNSKYMSVIFVASQKLLDKNFKDISKSADTLMDKINND